jgi:simple sugar transport system permease protein
MAAKKARFRLAQVRETGIVIAVIVAYLAFWLVAPRGFKSYENLTVILTMTSYVAIAAIGMTMVLTCGEIDLSFASIYGVTNIVFAYLLKNFIPGNFFLAVLISILFAAALGAVNGSLTLYSHVPSFIITLGTMLLYRSASLIISNAWPIMVEQTELERTAVGGSINGFPVMFLWMIAITVIFWIILEKTRFGNWTCATGDKLWAAQAAGINTNRVKLINFVLLAALSGLAGIMNASRLGSANPVRESGLLFDAVGGSIIGGTSMAGGSGTVIGSVLGAALIAIINNGLSVIGVPSFWYDGFVGAAIVVASMVNTAIARRRK